jgi:ppGpp synthetase/RelA/SpoT-type nucleotidyltranferase
VSDETDLTVYEKYRDLANVAIEAIETSIQNALRDLGDPYLVRAALDSFRIKSFDRLKQKAARFRWTIDQACKKAQDFIGFRVTCNNLQDVRRARDLLEESLVHKDYTVQVHDYVAEPKKDGYRAIHMVFAVPVKIGKEEAIINCEIQIRSRLQHTWADLSRADLYAATTDVPQGIHTKMQRLAALLAKADLVADQIRQRIARPRRGRKPAAGQSLSAKSLAFIYRRKFGSEAPDYLVQSLLRDYGDLEIRTDGLESTLADEEFIERLRHAYSFATRFEWHAEPEQIFRWAMSSLVNGMNPAILEAQRESRAEANDIDRIGRQDALVGLKENAKSLLSGLDQFDNDGDYDDDIEQYASGLGVLRRCPCGTAILDPREFSDAAVRYLKIRGRKADHLRRRLHDRAASSGVDPGGWNHCSLCSYCDGVFSKDD